MNIIVHRGLEQIGGCITEVSTETSRVFIDMGQNLPGNGPETTPDEDRKMVEGFFGSNAKRDEAVVYTHSHEDHVGLFCYVPDGVPQYIGEGGKKILLAKYNLLKKGHERCLSEIASAASSSAEGGQALAERLRQAVEEDDARIRKLKAFLAWKRAKPHTQPDSFMVGDIRITPFFNCHSVYDSYMLLIEADGKRIWHTGDYREHGYMGGGLMPTLRRYATDIDVLITEGTMLGRDDGCMHEREVARRMACVMNAFKYVVVLASATDIERLASVKEAAKKAHRAWYICSSYMDRTTRIFTEREAKVSRGLFEFRPQFVAGRDDPKIPAMKRKGFVLVRGVNKLALVEEICGAMDPSEVLLVYSSWDGYYKNPEQVRINPSYKMFREAFSNVVDIHTSGHADKATIRRVVETVNAKEVICIHKEKGTTLDS